MNTDSSAAYTNCDVTYTNGDVTYTNGDVTYTNGDVTYTNGDATYTNGDVTYTNRNQHNITETETETETVTETETETETETVTVTETETETVSEAEAQAIAEAQVQAITEAQTADSGIDGGIGIGGGIGIDGGNGGGTDTDSKKPTEDEVRRYCAQYALLVDPDRFYRYYEERDWMANGEPIQSWRAMADHWQKLGEQQRTAKAASVNTPPPSDETSSASCDLDAFIRASMDTPFDQL
ncbi:MAG: hypothetical protein IJW77_09875 [Clostridia bacterium]|nr:hypothetical protein [Clostridia bacterium]